MSPESADTQTHCEMWRKTAYIRSISHIHAHIEVYRRIVGLDKLCLDLINSHFEELIRFLKSQGLIFSVYAVFS